MTDAGLAYLLYAGIESTVALELPLRQKGAGIGMAPMRVYD